MTEAEPTGAATRYYRLADITIALSATFPLPTAAFSPAIQQFQVEQAGDDRVPILLASPLPPLADVRLDGPVYAHAPWAIYREEAAWCYVGFAPSKTGSVRPFTVARFALDYSRGTVYRDDFLGGLERAVSLFGFPTDQIILAPILARRAGCIMHGAAMIIRGKAFLFLGHSGAGKSTMVKMLRSYGQILNDDRSIIRWQAKRFLAYGSWSHGEVAEVSPETAPLAAVLLLEKAAENSLQPIEEPLQRLSVLASHVVRPLTTADWWQKTLDTLSALVAETPVYRLRFDRSGEARQLLEEL